MVFFFFFRKTNAAQNPHLARKVRDEPLGQKQRIVQHVELEARADSVHERVLELRRRHWGVSSGRGRGDSGERQRRRANVDAVFVNLLQWLLPRGRALLLLLVLMPVLLLCRHRDGSRHSWSNAAAARRHGRDGRVQGSVGDGHSIDRRKGRVEKGEEGRRLFSFIFFLFLWLLFSR